MKTTYPHQILIASVAAMLFCFNTVAPAADPDSADSDTAVPATEKASTNSGLPNIIFIFTDDQGYADIGVNGAKDFETPNIDQLAKDGMRFTDFYAAAPSCTPSRIALLTGCYPQRVSLPRVIGPNSQVGISSEEITIAEMLQTKGYATACFGKWHLGDAVKFLPLQHGFDEYFGLPYSNDMWPYHPTNKKFPKLPLIDGTKVLNENVTAKDQTQLTTWYTERSVKFIEEQKDQPFFLYLPHSMPHVPLYVSDKFKGKSKQGLYGDVIMEIDWSVGQIVDTLKKHHLDENTFLFYSSDNGPWLSYGNHAGSARPLREGKGTTWEGGQREPCVMKWPAKIPAGTVCKTPAMTIDLFPTIAQIVDAKLPEHPIDGKSILPLLTAQPNAKSPQEAYYFFNGSELHAVRSGNWKLHFPHGYRTLEGRNGGKDGTPVAYSTGRTELALYDLSKDIGEQKNVLEEHPDVVENLTKLADA